MKPMKVWIDFVDDDTPSRELAVVVVPRIGEKVGVRQPDGMEGTNVFALDYVVDVRHYLTSALHEIRVLVSSRP